MKKILVIEDEMQIRNDIMKTLELCNYEVYGAPNGKAGLQVSLEQIPDLIISDIMMPELNGYELLNELQKYKETAHIPFLFLSAKSDKTDIREGMKLGADDFLTKPFDIDELIEAVEARLKRKERSEQKYMAKFEDLRENLRRTLPHEIRTPMGVILGFTDFLIKSYDTSSPEEAQEMLTNIKSSAERLNNLFENYLLYANLEIIASNEEEMKKLLQQTTISPEKVIKSVAHFRSKAAKRDQDINLDLEDVEICMSEEYFLKLIEELFDNAMKYSDSGSPIHIVSQKNISMYKIVITDHGRGMTPEQISSIGAYVQFERKIYEQQGSGLGLTISKRLVELHKGLFSINSHQGEYTSITVELPYLHE